MDNKPAESFSLPYFAVIFVSRRTIVDAQYDDMAQQMLQLAKQQPGFLGVDSVRDSSRGITVSYWESEQAIAHWKLQIDHQQAQQKGREAWYENYQVHISKVERFYSFEKYLNE